METADYGIVYKPDDKKMIEWFVDADFGEGWSKLVANNAQNVMSRTGYVITYAEFPVLWCSKLQTEIALSKTEAENFALSQRMHDVTTFMFLLREFLAFSTFTFP